MRGIGVVDNLAARRDAGLALVRCPRARAAILGVPYRLPPAKTHVILVDVPSGLRQHRCLDAAVSQKVNPFMEAKPKPRPPKVWHDRITQTIDAVCKAWGITRAELVGIRRPQRLARPRFACYRLLRDLEMSTTIIGRTLGKRDHTSVMSGLRRIESFLQFDRDWAMKFDQARAIITAGRAPQGVPATAGTLPATPADFLPGSAGTLSEDAT